MNLAKRHPAGRTQQDEGMPDAMIDASNGQPLHVICYHVEKFAGKA